MARHVETDSGLDLLDSAGASAQGEDRGSYQGNGTAPWNPPLSFGFAKATEGAPGTPTEYTDPSFGNNWHGMERLVWRGAYHFFHPSYSAVTQAEFFWDTVRAHGLRAGDALVCDVEIQVGLGGFWLIKPESAARSHTVQSGPAMHMELRPEIVRAVAARSGVAAAIPLPAGVTVVDAGARVFLDKVHALAGPEHPVLVYTDLSVGASLVTCTGYALWIAYYNDVPPSDVSPWHNWLIWQWGNGGGQTGGDRDAFDGSVDELRSYVAKFGKPGPPPPPPPPHTSSHRYSQEDNVGYLPNSGAGSVSDICLPDGTASVRFFSSQPSKISVDLRHPPLPAVEVSLGAVSQTVAIPPDTHAIIVTRQDAGTHEVSFALST